MQIFNHSFNFSKSTLIYHLFPISVFDNDGKAVQDTFLVFTTEWFGK